MAAGKWKGDAKGVGWFQDQPSGDASPTSTTYVTIPGLSITVTSPGLGASWMVTIDADVRISVAATTNTVELVVDGTPILPAIVTAGPAALRSAGSKTWIVTGMPAGSFAFTARTHNTAASTGADVFAAHTQMTVRQI